MSSFKLSASKKNQSPGRTLGITIVVLILLFGVAILQGATVVKLGLDLRGGTSVTLQPRVTEGVTGAVTNESIDQAVSIIRQRVNSLGVAESEVMAQGTGTDRRIVISVPGQTGQNIVELVGQTAELRFRQVIFESTSLAPTTDTATTAALEALSPEISARFAALDCASAEVRKGTGGDDPAAIIVACEKDGRYKYVLAEAKVIGRDISKASAAIDASNVSGWYVTLDFNSEGANKFGQITSSVVNLPSPQNQVAIVLDGVVYSAPRINEAITGGSAQITGSFTQAEARGLANVLKYGALPLAFTQDEVQQISPTLGANQLKAGLLAGYLGLFLVLLYSVLYYRGLGLVSVGSLFIAAAFVYVSFLLLGEWIGFTLTLAGIAGAIVAIGITADSFIVYFERLRDEVREGKSLRSAAEAGWVRARRTIVVADLVSILAAVVLYIFAVGGVRGFAFTLGLITLIDLLVVFFFTKPLVTLLAKTAFYSSGSSISGFSNRSLGIAPTPVSVASSMSAQNPEEK